MRRAGGQDECDDATRIVKLTPTPLLAPNLLFFALSYIWSLFPSSFLPPPPPLLGSLPISYFDEHKNFFPHSLITPPSHPNSSSREGNFSPLFPAGWLTNPSFIYLHMYVYVCNFPITKCHSLSLFPLSLLYYISLPLTRPLFLFSLLIVLHCSSLSLSHAVLLIIDTAVNRSNQPAACQSSSTDQSTRVDCIMFVVFIISTSLHISFPSLSVASS